MHLRLPLPVLLLATALVGCSDLGDPYELAADCDRSTGSLSFGEVDLGRVADRTLVVGNSGNDSLVCTIELNDPEFSVLEGSGTVTIAPGESHSVTVRFAPAVLGGHESVLDLGDGCPPVSISGSGGYPAGGPQCQILPAALDFGDVKTGQVKDTSFEIRNVGLVAFDIDVVLASGGPFTILSGLGSATLQPNEIDTVAVRFAPTVIADASTTIQIGSACGSIGVDGAGISPTTVSYATQIQPIFNANCVICHGTNPRQGGLDLRAANSYAGLVNRVSVGYAPSVRVSPGNPGGSVLFGKITGSNFGEQMPPGFLLLPQQEQDRITTWVLEGALRN